MRLSIHRLVLRTLCYYGRTNLAVVLGVAVAGAVLTGSLIVGDSVRETLRDIALERLGRVDHALLSESFFREQLAADVAGLPGWKQPPELSAAIILDGTARQASSGVVVPAVTVVGVRDDFWRVGFLPASWRVGKGAGWQAEGLNRLEERRVIINQNLAEDLGAGVGDALILAVGRRGSVPVETLFGRRRVEDTVRALRVIVGRIIPSSGLGRFSLRNDQPQPRNVYISLAWLQRQLHRQGQANAILAGSPGEGAGLDEALTAVARLEDYGLTIVPNAAQGYLSLESSRLVLPGWAVQTALEVAGESGIRVAPASVYLANALRLSSAKGGDPGIPYSLVAAFQGSSGVALGSLRTIDGKVPPDLGAHDILLTAWAADDLGAKVGDQVEMSYYVAGERGTLSTATREFTVRGIVAMSGAAVDAGLVPAFEGITDAKTMADWDPPFPVNLKWIRPKDEEYWGKYRAAPKAFVSMDAVRTFWRPVEPGRGWEGWVTSIRVTPAEGEDLERTRKAFEQSLLRRVSGSEAGLTFLPVKAQALAAAQGATDFGRLFLSLGAFLVASAIGLVALLLRLTIERRANQYGILLATGFEPAGASRLLMSEGFLLALAGTGLGAVLGLAYAQFILHSLGTRWSGATGGVALSLHVSARSLIVGCVAGLLVSMLAMLWSAQALRRTPALTLLAGWRALAVRSEAMPGRGVRWVGIAALALALALLLLSALFAIVSPPMAFFSAGAALLVGALALLSAGFRRRGTRASDRSLSLIRLAWRAARGHWVRSLLTVGLLASASFIIVAVAANRRATTGLGTRDRSSGAGGFNLVARSDLPVYHDLNSEEGRKQLGFSAQDSAALAEANILALRVGTGEDVSCLNLQRPTRPRVLGVPGEAVARGGFAFARVLGRRTKNPWELLEKALPDGAVPAFADATSAQWNLHVALGDEIAIPGENGRPVRLRIAGLLADSVFASELLISEDSFRRHFGTSSGYRYFLIETPPEREAAVRAALQAGLGELGLQVNRSADILANYARVQNAYVGAFQTLGGLGLLLGTFGVVLVLLRGVLERRGELAIMLALGLRRWQLGVMIALENGLLLVLGVAIGTVAALVAVTPYLVSALADVRWFSLAAVLLACVLVGFASCAIATAVVMRGELLPALRSE